LHKKTKWQLFIDGASRNNPGPSGAGIYLVKNHEKESAYGFFLGTKTNNQAEYLALVIGLIIAIPKLESHDDLEIISDSQLLINQINGLYQVKNPDLKILYNQAIKLLEDVAYHARHVLRADNQNADAMANLGIDQKIAITPEIKAKLHEIKL
jgi:ribonuclease HI